FLVACRIAYEESAKCLIAISIVYGLANVPRLVDQVVVIGVALRFGLLMRSKHEQQKNDQRDAKHCCFLRLRHQAELMTMFCALHFLRFSASTGPIVNSLFDWSCEAVTSDLRHWSVLATSECPYDDNTVVSAQSVLIID